jgi:cytochrome c peroxidase
MGKKTMMTKISCKKIVGIAVLASLSTSAYCWDVLPKIAPAPVTNPFSVAKSELGKKLFFDPRISRSGTISCQSCHNVMGGGEDSRAHSAGVGGKLGGRSSPTVWNAAFQSVQFWDGRAASLEDQAIGPMTNPVEMAMASHDLVVKRLKQIPEYVTEFKKAFKDSKEITIGDTAKAIATYERTLITPNSPYDRFVSGEKGALSASAKRGMKTVQTVGCLACHSGANFSGPKLPVGQGFFMKFPLIAGSEFEKKFELTKDLGRFEVTKNESDKNMWRVPTWRNIAITAPYFHNGSVKTLNEAVLVMGKTQLGKDLKKEEVSDIVAFLESLTGEFPIQVMPRLPMTSGFSLINED